MAAGMYLKIDMSHAREEFRSCVDVDVDISLVILYFSLDSFPAN